MKLANTSCLITRGEKILTLSSVDIVHSSVSYYNLDTMRAKCSVKDVTFKCEHILSDLIF